MLSGIGHEKLYFVVKTLWLLFIIAGTIQLISPTLIISWLRSVRGARSARSISGTSTSSIGGASSITNNDESTDGTGNDSGYTVCFWAETQGPDNNNHNILNSTEFHTIDKLYDCIGSITINTDNSIKNIEHSSPREDAQETIN